MSALAIDVEAAAAAGRIRRCIEAVEERDVIKRATVVGNADDVASYGSLPGQIVGWDEVEGAIGGIFGGPSHIEIAQTDLRIRPGDRLSAHVHRRAGRKAQEVHRAIDLS